MSIAKLIAAAMSGAMVFSGLAAAEDLNKASVSKTTEAVCEYGAKCAESEARRDAEATLLASCKAALGEKAIVIGIQASPAQCATLGPGEVGASMSKCKVTVTASCASPKP